MKALCDDVCPDAEVIRVVLDSLNTHAFGPPFAAFPQARRGGGGWSSTTPRSTGRG